MAATSLEPEQKITYDIIREEDSEQVLQLLKNTFFKVSTSWLVAREKNLSRVWLFAFFLPLPSALCKSGKGRRQ
jgi:hypothetical protein